jgi:hypothetical protein
MTQHFNKLSAAEDEQLAILIERCADVISACTKIQRHGYESRNPFDPLSQTNRQSLEEEIKKMVFSAILISGCELTITADESERFMLQWHRWAHHQ